MIKKISNFLNSTIVINLNNKKKLIIYKKDSIIIIILITINIKMNEYIMIILY